jgi:lysophospholipase L1-like esterase
MKKIFADSVCTPSWMRIFIILTGLLILNDLHSAASSGIQIENTTRQLVAPHGDTYQWFQNGKLLAAQRQQNIKVTQSGEYTVEITGTDGKKSVELIRVLVVNGIVHRIYVIGDSTVATYNESSYPQKGWGQILQLFFNKSEIEVVNKSIGGRSSRSFYQEGRWTEVFNSLVSGDYVFIQFGHNDRDWTKPERYTDTTDYKYYLRIYVNETRAKGAVPVLVSPMIMHAYRGTVLRNVFTENENDYRGAMLQVAQELDVPFIDLNIKSYNKVLEVGQEYAANFLYLGLLPGEYPNFPNGSSDGTHFQEMGALEMGKLIIEGINELESDTNMARLCSALVPTYDVEIGMNIPEAGLYTLTGKYPAGAQVTIKTRLKNGYSFYQWVDDSMHVLSENNLNIFTMMPQNYSFKALVKDCNGTVGGSAMPDNCGICSGGTAENLPCSNTFQSEKACEYSGTIESQLISGVNRTYINTGSADSPYVLYALHASTAGVYQFGLVYSSPDTSQLINVYVNDVNQISNLEIEKTEEWKTAWIELDLQQGTNDVKIVPQDTGESILLDQLAGYSNELSDGTCRISGVNNLEQPVIIVFPNPFRETFKITGIEDLKYQIYNVMGVLVDLGTCDEGCNIGKDLSNGLYFLSAMKDSIHYTQVIQKF